MSCDDMTAAEGYNLQLQGQIAELERTVARRTEKLAEQYRNLYALSCGVKAGAIKLREQERKAVQEGDLVKARSDAKVAEFLEKLLLQHGITDPPKTILVHDGEELELG